ncbi:transporter substrate-binding domain-containing protein [Pseudoalteromonas sp. SMS1]|uniref:substrate-binding periplasmic protein n=1 Tax=Pseudoalteromonas sp. SMS1 TaxID=2908894 RepID=UPI001F3E5ED2|nr:transporter substrate-binding domain-containing protein [Pseudoalteromonas sp. SMS1]MCF2856850.1 transporter substrate-binding domain-containing protein [Pseudoalteromonas sp. SMS1]
MKVQWLTIFLCLWVMSEHANAQNVRHKLLVSMHPLDPFIITEQGEVQSGFVVDIFEELQRINGRKHSVQISSFARGIKMLEKGSKVVRAQYRQTTVYHRAHLIVAQTPARFARFKWVGPFLFDGPVLYQRSKDTREFNSLEDVKQNEATCITQHRVRDTELYTQHQIPFHETQSQERAIQLLLQPKSRFDCTMLSVMNTREVLSAAGHPLSHLKAMNITLPAHGLYMAFSLDTPDHIIAQWQLALDQLNQTNKRLEIIQRYAPFYTQKLEEQLRESARAALQVVAENK